jgi:hypothetical protein
LPGKKTKNENPPEEDKKEGEVPSQPLDVYAGNPPNNHVLDRTNTIQTVPTPLRPDLFEPELK